MTHNPNRMWAAGVLLAFALAAFPATATAATTPTLTATPTEGTVQTPVTLVGAGLTPGATVDIIWQTMEGNRVSGGGYEEIFWTLGQAKADAAGGFRFEFKAPYDLGGPAHRIEARVGDEIVATALFTILRTAEISPTSGPRGTTIELHMTGGGWTQYDNIVAVTYDNVFMGFMCSFNSQGNMTLWLPATGAPGLHTIDVYPAIYWGPSEGPTPWKIAHVSDGDQPTKIPKYHFEFQLTEGPAVLRLEAGDDALPVNTAPPSVADLLAQLKGVAEPRLALSAELLPVGYDFAIAGGGFEPGAAVKLVWNTVTVKTEIWKDKNKGWNATPTTRELASAKADANGFFSTILKVPEDFGGMHDIQAFVGDKQVAQTALQIKPRFEFLGPEAVKPGETVKIRGYGLGYEKYTSVWSVLYDNQLNGWISAFETQGTVTFEVYAVGDAGRHYIDIHEGSNGWPYLNLWESPWPWEPPAHFSFEILPTSVGLKTDEVTVVKTGAGNPASADTGDANDANDDANEVPLPTLALFVALVLAALVARRRR